MEACGDKQMVFGGSRRLRGDLACVDRRRDACLSPGLCGSQLLPYVALCWIAILVSVASGCRAVEHKILYAPDTYPQRWWQPVEGEMIGLSFEDVNFQSVDGTALNGWYVRPESQTPSQVVVYAHGRNANISITKRFLFEFVRRHQVAVFAFDYRGYGKSAGRPSEQGIYQDLRAARDWACARTGRDPSDIVLMGRSMGAAAVIDLAAQEPPKAMIIESAFTSSADVLKYYTKNFLQGKRIHSSFDSLSKIGNYPGPVFIGHGKYDKTIPCTHSARLADAAVCATRVKLSVFDGGHLTSTSDDYTNSMHEFFENL